MKRTEILDKYIDTLIEYEERETNYLYTLSFANPINIIDCTIKIDKIRKTIQFLIEEYHLEQEMEDIEVNNG